MHCSPVIETKNNNRSLDRTGVFVSTARSVDIIRGASAKHPSSTRFDCLFERWRPDDIDGAACTIYYPHNQNIARTKTYNRIWSLKTHIEGWKLYRWWTTDRTITYPIQIKDKIRKLNFVYVRGEDKILCLKRFADERLQMDQHCLQCWHEETRRRKKPHLGRTGHKFMMSDK